MPEDAKIKIVAKIGRLTEKVDRKALAGAVGLMMLSWGALPIIYWLIVHRNTKEKKKEVKEEK